MTGMSMDDFRTQYKDQSLERVKAQLAMEAVQKVESIEVTDEDVDAELVKVAEESKKTLEEVKKTFEGANLDYIKETVLATKTMDFLKEQVKVEATKKQEKPKTDD